MVLNDSLSCEVDYLQRWKYNREKKAHRFWSQEYEFSNLKTIIISMALKKTRMPFESLIFFKFSKKGFHYLF